MKNLNEREKAIKEGYLSCLNGKQKASALRSNGKWTPTNNPRKCSKIWFKTPDGLQYSASAEYIEKTFFDAGEL